MKKKERIKVKCEVCGKEVERLESQLKKHIFCSKKCSNSPEGRRLYQGGEDNPKYNSKPVNCDYCGKEFKATKKRIENSEHLYCCKECYFLDAKNIHKKGKENPCYNKIKCKCDYCGGEIEIIPSKMKDREYHFCNMNCRSLWQKNHFKGSNNPNYNPNLTDQNREDRRKNQEYKDWRNNVFLRDDYTCIISGEKGKEIIAHHLYSYDKYNELRFDVSNGVTISIELHKEFHKKYGYGNNTLEQFEEFYKDKTGKDFKIN